MRYLYVILTWVHYCNDALNGQLQLRLTTSNSVFSLSLAIRKQLSGNDQSQTLNLPIISHYIIRQDNLQNRLKNTRYISYVMYIAYAHCDQFANNLTGIISPRSQATVFLMAFTIRNKQFMRPLLKVLYIKPHYSFISSLVRQAACSHGAVVTESIQFQTI